MSRSTDRSLQLIRTLDASGQAAAIALVNELRAQGLPAIVTSARRSAAHQSRLIAAGKTTATRSHHLRGRALDIGFAGVSTAAVPASWWRFAGQVWESYGGRWGGRFSRPDPLHFDW